ncbi:hypothetical protein EGR_03271 [Echinococcus granulosus]|uniref:Uncharacterized protein n=1 Tax=Echinococcus granulosus TaxID=6210 RepID=W6ULR9_ECHGR|nr:hypothetical protein EGR_03271 [Echinococcus granulosus]EUB61998.1 hypothetical protein EGR_03271 [Echinococcus granulosus]
MGHAIRACIYAALSWRKKLNVMSITPFTTSWPRRAEMSAESVQIVVKPPEAPPLYFRSTPWSLSRACGHPLS